MNKLLAEYSENRLQHVDTSGTVSGVYICDLNEDSRDSEHESDEDNSENEEATKYAEKEFKNYFNDAVEEYLDLADIEDGREESLFGSEICGLVRCPRVFGAYRFDTYYKKELPIDDFKEKIINRIEINAVTIISGKTGCGKTTQVPQYILDQCKAQNQPCNIVCTQPRRIAAINIAQRVCEERGWALGTVVGYQVGLDKNLTEDVVLTYMTTEVLLQKLIQQKNLNKYTHIIIDEVHERDLNLDFLLLIVRKYLLTNSPRVKVILMSATMEEEEFAYYFRGISRNDSSKFLNAPIIPITRKAQYPINFYFLDNFTNIFMPIDQDFNMDDPCIVKEQYNLAAKLVQLFDSVDEKDPLNQKPIVGSVLIFLPGYHEIEELISILNDPKFKSEKHVYEIIPLHSSLATEQMAKAFLKPKSNVRKIILSTNIAESSVTVPDVTYVIDFCLTKVMVVDPVTKFSSLSLQWASHVNCKQRAGRVGRVSAGKVYRLIPEEFYNHQMPKSSIPEILSAPLEKIILYMKLLDLNDPPKNILSLAISPPKLNDVENSIWHLKEAGALLQTCRGRPSTSDGDLTFIGRVMGNLPLDIHLSRLILLGHMFSCLEETIIMAAGAVTRNLFTHEFGQKFTAYKKKLLWADNSSSDLILLLTLYNVWVSSRRENAFKNTTEELLWCKTNFVNMKGLREWDLLIKEIQNRLKKFQIERSMGPTSLRIPSTSKSLVLKVVICGAFYPNYFIRSSHYGQVDYNDAVKVMNGRDPFNSVYFTNMKLGQPGQIYVREIKKLINAENDSSVHVGFDNQSSKIYIEFKSVRRMEPVTVDGHELLTENFGKIPTQIYEAVKRRLLRLPHHLRVLPCHQAWEFASSAQISLYEKAQVSSVASEETLNCFSDTSYSPIPSLDMQYMTVRVVHVVNASRFYCQHINDETGMFLQRIFNALNGPAIFLSQSKDLKVGEQLYAARFSQDGKFYRCKILSIHPNKYKINLSDIWVLFVDYGNTQKVSSNEVYKLPISDHDNCLQMTSMALECRLSGIHPSVTRYPSGNWGMDATETFTKKTSSIVLYAKVYSVVENVVNVELFRDTNNRSLNQFLLDQGFAEKCTENYMSQQDHTIRTAVLESDNPKTDAKLFLNHTKIDRYQDFEQPIIDAECEIVHLKGPYSPLEMNVCGVIQASQDAHVRFDQDSVNSVLLDDNPSDPHARLVVAGQVIKADGSRVLKIGLSTVMPNIRGFPMFMLLAFCPNMEPKLTTDCSRVASVLCGLGAPTYTHKSYYPSHDITFALDTELTAQIIEKVNELRFCMNRAIKIMSNISDELNYAEDFYAIQKSIHEVLLGLLKQKPPKSVQPVNVAYASVWNKTDPNIDILKMTDKGSDDDIWSMLWFVNLQTGMDGSRNIKRNIDELTQMAKRLIPEEPTRCELCKCDLFSCGTVRNHLLSKEHKEKLKEYVA